MNRLHLASAFVACSAISGLAAAAEDVPKACCLPDGSCWNVTPDLCADWGGIEAPDGTFCSAWDCTPPDPVDCCEFGKPSALMLKYTGESCEATSHEQEDGSVFCSGDPAGAESVYIIVSDRHNLEFHRTHIWFEDVVTLGESFIVDSAVEGRRKIGAKTFVFIYDLDGELLQEVEFHTSCSQPLWHGDQFGAIELVECLPCLEECEERECEPERKCERERKCEGGKRGKREKCQKRGKRGGKRDKCDRGGSKRDKGRKGGGKRGGRGGQCRR